jgi:hypothetical protein
MTATGDDPSDQLIEQYRSYHGFRVAPSRYAPACLTEVKQLYTGAGVGKPVILRRSKW